MRKIMSLKSVVDGVSYNCGGNLLALSSSVCKDSLRMVKQPSCTICSRWPTSKTPVNFVFCTTFSREKQVSRCGQCTWQSVIIFSQIALKLFICFYAEFNLLQR